MGSAGRRRRKRYNALRCGEEKLCSATRGRRSANRPTANSTLSTSTIRTSILFRVSAVNGVGASEPCELAEPITAKNPFSKFQVDYFTHFISLFVVDPCASTSLLGVNSLLIATTFIMYVVVGKTCLLRILEKRKLCAYELVSGK
jgi:hypothetical protein